MVTYKAATKLTGHEFMPVIRWMDNDKEIAQFFEKISEVAFVFFQRGANNLYVESSLNSVVIHPGDYLVLFCGRFVTIDCFLFETFFQLYEEDEAGLLTPTP